MPQGRRANNEGTIVQRSDGRWCGAVSLPDGSRKWVYGKTRRDVADRMKAILRELQQGVLPAPEHLTVRDVLEQWLTEGARMSVRASTFRSYSDIVRLHLVPELGHVRLAKLQPQHVERLLNRKLEEGLSARRVQYIHAVLRRALGRAVRWGVLARNVATLVDAPRVVRPEVQPLTPAEIAAFLQAVSGDRLEVLYLLALSTGLRQGELLALRWADVDLEAGSLHVRRSLQRVSGELRYEEPKSLRSRRIVLLPASVGAALRAHSDRQGREQRRARDQWEDTGLVFTTAHGRPLDGTNVTHRFQKALADAGLPRRRFHDLRHSCATVLLAQGVPARVVMELLGHSQIAVTMNTYSHVLPEMRKDAADLMGGFLDDLGKRGPNRSPAPATVVRTVVSRPRRRAGRQAEPQDVGLTSDPTTT